MTRPQECEGCKRPLCVRYRQISAANGSKPGSFTCQETEHCAECPVVEQNLRGADSELEFMEEGAGVQAATCPSCHTSISQIQRQQTVGCEICYQTFAAEITASLGLDAAAHHLGRKQGQSHELDPKLRILALNQALDAALKAEDYEQAALLRDQIKKIAEPN